ARQLRLPAGGAPVVPPLLGGEVGRAPVVGEGGVVREPDLLLVVIGLTDAADALDRGVGQRVAGQRSGELVEVPDDGIPAVEEQSANLCAVNATSGAQVCGGPGMPLPRQGDSPLLHPAHEVASDPAAPEVLVHAAG